MNSRTVGIIATVLTALVCGCAAIFSCIFGAMGATGTPFNTELNGVQGSAPMPMALAVTLLCLSVIFILIPVAVGFFTLRNKPPKPAVPVSAEPLPPAS